MTSHSAALVTYEIIVPNVNLNDDSVVEAMRMDFIIVEVIVKDKMKRIRINDVFHVPNFKSYFFH